MRQMRIAVINEVSAKQKNQDILLALDGHGHEILNLGMRNDPSLPELTYIHTGLMSAILLNAAALEVLRTGGQQRPNFRQLAVPRFQRGIEIIYDPVST